MIKNILLVALGGGAGSILRYLCSRWIQMHQAGGFPWGTFAVNISGCLLIGIFWGLAARHEYFSEPVRLLLMTGLCGGFTTFSALSIESISLIKEQKTGLMFFYIVISIITGLAATYTGIKLIK